MPVAFEAKSTEIRYRLKELFGSPTQIESISMDRIFLGVEFSNPLGTANNWTAIAANMPEQKSNARVMIQKLVLTNLTIEIRGVGLKGKTIKKTVPRLEFDNIDSEQGFPTEELIKKVFGGSGIQQYIQNAFDATRQIQNLINPFGK